MPTIYASLPIDSEQNINPEPTVTDSERNFIFRLVVSSQIPQSPDIGSLGRDMSKESNVNGRMFCL